MEGATTSGSLDPTVVHPKGSPANPSWKYRRIVIYTSLAFNLVVLTAIVIGWFFDKQDSRVMQIIAGGSIAQSTAIIGSYVFGAAFENINIMKWFGGGGSFLGNTFNSVTDGENTRVI